MQAMFHSITGRELTVRQPFEDFLTSGHMLDLSARGACTPEALLLDHLPEIVDVADDEELAQAFAEACEHASDEVVHHVRLDRRDVRYIRRRHLGSIPQMQLLGEPDFGMLQPA